MTKELFDSLKPVGDKFINEMHRIKGFHYDSISGFRAYLKEFKALQQKSIRQTNTNMALSDRGDIIYAKGGPEDPKAIVMHVVSPKELKERLSKNGLNEMMVGQHCLVMIYEYWERIRREFASVLNISRDEIKEDVFGDLRKLRHDITHNLGFVTKEHSGKNKELNWFEVGDYISIDGERFDWILEQLFLGINSLFMKWTGEVGYSENSLSLKGKAKQMNMLKKKGIKDV